ncbi:MAG TPA: hypothetical protein VNU92_12750 [Edaphobacter sp.]|jgi:hypothetical protein|nr:hypothetical protein [Edaphobacter sp.]
MPRAHLPLSTPIFPASFAAFVVLTPTTKFVLIVIAIVVGLLLVVAFISLLVLFFFIRKNHPDVKDGLAKVRSVLHLIRCYILIYLWKFRFQLKALVPAAIFVIFTIAGFFTILELTLKIFEFIERNGGSRFLPFSPESLQMVLDGCEYVLRFFFENPWVLILLLLVEALIFYHHIHEFHHRRHHRTTLTILGELLGPLNELTAFLSASTVPVDMDQARINFMGKFNTAFSTILALWGVKHANICLMEHKAATNLLTVVYENSGGKDFQVGFTLDPTEGAAGKAFTLNQLIYVPNIKYEHGVAVLPAKLDVLTSVYKEGNHPFKSIFCVPINTSASTAKKTASKTVGVLNLSCQGTSAFSDPNFVIAKLGGTVLGLMYNW